MREASLTLGEAEALVEMQGAASALTMTELADRVILSRTRVSRLVDGLEHSGLVKRAVDPQDKRVWRVTVTALGNARVQEVLPVYRAALRRAFGSALPNRELESLATQLETLSRHDLQA